MALESSQSDIGSKNYKVLKMAWLAAIYQSMASFRHRWRVYLQIVIGAVFATPSMPSWI